MLRKAKYYYYLCLQEEPCIRKRIDKKTKKPICRIRYFYENDNFLCSQQYRVTQHRLDTERLDLNKLRQERLMNP